MALDEVLLAAYRAASYRILWQEQPITLQVGWRVSAACALLQQLNAPQGFFLTACNPRSQVQSEQDNARAMVRLAQQLRGAGGQVLDAVACDPTGLWPDEPSWFVTHIEAELVMALAEDYQQNAFLQVDGDGLVSLQLCHFDNPGV